MNRLSAFAAAFALATLCPGCEDIPGAADPGGPSGEGLIITKLFDADFPVAMAFAPDGRCFYTEKNTGRVRVIKGGTLLGTPFATLPTNSAGERGLLGIALHLDFDTNGWVYVYYTRAGGNVLGASTNRVARLVADGDVSDGTETTIIDLPVSGALIHNGGNLRFGPDGKLYVSLGELDDQPAAQDTNSVKGKILRLNDDGTTPTDNPFPGSMAYAYGLRNSFDLAFDPISEELFATENGPGTNDEVNRILAGGNYGWPGVEGTADPGAEANFAAMHSDYVEPLVAITPTTAPTGIDFAPTTLFGADFKSDLFYGEYKTGRVWRMDLNEDRKLMVDNTEFIIGIPGGITDVAFAPDGSLYILTSDAIWHAVPE